MATCHKNVSTFSLLEIGRRRLESVRLFTRRQRFLSIVSEIPKLHGLLSVGEFSLGNKKIDVEF